QGQSQSQNKGGRNSGARQAFSGPMDHSYRQNGEANGNSVQASNSSLNGRPAKHFGRGGERFRRFGKRQQEQAPNAQHLPGFVAQAPAPEPGPVAHHDDGVTRIFAFIEDLFFMTKIMDTA